MVKLSRRTKNVMIKKHYERIMSHYYLLTQTKYSTKSVPKKDNEIIKIFNKKNF